ncbi:MAG: protein kinase [Candidatus Cloacimonetes bacterium]|nr:protein kinase [Candidatus Cloacimonadota bacterium]
MIIASRYKVLKEMGTGQWARVYKVQDMRTDHIYRLKLFHKLSAHSLYEKFSAEKMHHITKIQHENLIHVTDFGNFGEHIYYISEFYSGNTLRNFRLKTINVEFLYDIIVQICYGLNALHSQKIIHQNIKPENILYSVKEDNPEVRLMDFGFTKLDLEKSQQKVSSTLPYIAPELYLDQEILYQSDFYSLGVMLYKIATGNLPYTVEQISGFIDGKRYNLFPKFPRELNPEVPDHLEKLILKLLERNPEDRFENCEDIISYINQIQIKQYPFSRSWSIVNNIKFSDYIVREDYAHQLLEYIPLIKKGNGKVIVMTAGNGLGKTNILALFRYHLLTDEFHIFDYECGPKHKDPFFGLIKEFYHAVENNQILAEDLSRISPKLHEYLFESEETAAMRKQNQDELSLDFQSASRFLFHLSEDKPLVFMVRAGQYLEKEVVDFVNFISKKITSKPILIIFSVNDPRRIEGLIHPVRLTIEPLDLHQTQEYVERLLKVSPPADFLNLLWERSNGNPWFIEEILIDLTQNKQIWKNQKFQFDFHFHDYTVPETVKHSIYLRMAHLSADSYKYLQKLAFVRTPLSKNLMKFVLDLTDKQVFILIRDVVSNELIREKGEYYHFTFQEAVARFRAEGNQKIENQVSAKVLSYFENKELTEIGIVRGIITHATIIPDYAAVRKYSKHLVMLLFQQSMRELAFDEMVTVTQLDFSGKLKLSSAELKKDLNLLVDLAEWATVTKVPAQLKQYVVKMPDVAEKHLLMGVFYYSLEKYHLAQCRLQKALSLSITGKDRANILLKLAEIYSILGNREKLGQCINQLAEFPLTNEMKITFISLKGLFMGLSGQLQEGIELIEEFIPQIRTQNDDSFFIKLGNLHNTLAYLLHQDRSLDEAEKNFQKARKIWEKVDYKRKLGIVYNNLGDVALVQGYTKNALEYFQKALAICEEVDSKKIRILSLLNHGETYIKIGEFDQAEQYLQEALKKTVKLEHKPFYDSIINNIAIAKGKVHNYKYYYDFIREHAPEVIEGKIKKVTPLIKTYFYYLYNIGDYKKIEKLLLTYKDLFFSSKQEEFYYQILGFITLQRKDYDNALKRIELAFKYSQESRSVYAQAINYIRLAEYYLAVGETGKSMEILLQSRIISEQNNYDYWIRVIDLRMIRAQLDEGNTSLRWLIRQIQEILEYVTSRNLFYLQIECYEILTQIFSYLGSVKNAEICFQKYRDAILNATSNISQRDKQIYFKKTGYHLSDYEQLKTVRINYQRYQNPEIWQEELYDILKLRDNDRISFFLDKAIKNLLSPHFYAIFLNEDLQFRGKPIISYNIDYQKLYRTRYLKNIRLCIETNNIIIRKILGCHIVFVPLRIKSAKVGCMIVADKGELAFQSDELAIISNLRLHLSSILIRISEFEELNEDMQLMTKLIQINQRFFSQISIEKLEQDIVTFVLDFTGGSRGFLIKKDKYENYLFKVALDDSKHMLKNFTYVSKSILSEVHKNREPIFLENIRENKGYDAFFNFNFETLSVYCAPIQVESVIYGYLYIDNYNAPDSRIKINKEFMTMLLNQISAAVKNSLQYEALMQKNQEINALENLKNDFINIVSHELRTPLVTLQGYVNRILKFKLPKNDLRVVQQVEKSVEKLYQITNDIINHNRYILTKQLDRSVINIKDILEIIADEARTISKSRHMRIQLEVEANLPPVKINWEAFHLMIYNIVLNAIRFTRDFGTIVIGARLSAFQQEEIEGKESLLLYVQDNGIGIAAGELDRIFQKFYELNKIYSHSSGLIEFKSGGLGLGLSTARLIADLHDGKIWVSSKEKEGTTVFIAIPTLKTTTEQ